MDLLSTIIFLLVMKVTFNISEKMWTKNLAIEKAAIPRGNDSFSYIYTVLLDYPNVLPSIPLLVSSQTLMGTSPKDSSEVDYCNDDQKKIFLAIERSTNIILTGFWVMNDGNYLNLECTKSHCKVSHHVILAESPSHGSDGIFRREKRSSAESNDSIPLLAITDAKTRTFHVSVLFIVDSATVKAHCESWPECCASVRRLKLCNKIISYYSNMMAAGSQLYAGIDNSQMAINLYLADLVLLPEVRGRSYFDRLLINGTENEVMANDALLKSIDLLTNSSFGQRLNKNYDAVVFFLSHRLKSQRNSYYAGYASVGDVCKTSGVALIRETLAYRSFFIFVHELAHVLGAEHDGYFQNCGPKDNRLMGAEPNSDDPSKMFHFSCCSLISMYKTLRKAKCVASPPADATNISNYNPNLGELVDRNEYCHLVYGHDYRSCQESAFYCDRILCQENNDSECVFNMGFPVLNGMSCSADNSKWCMHGHCVPKEASSFQDDVQRNCNVVGEERSVTRIRSTRTTVDKLNATIPYTSITEDQSKTTKVIYISTSKDSTQNSSTHSAYSTTAINSTDTTKDTTKTEETALTSSTMPSTLTTERTTKTELNTHPYTNINSTDTTKNTTYTEQTALANSNIIFTHTTGGTRSTEHAAFHNTALNSTHTTEDKTQNVHTNYSDSSIHFTNTVDGTATIELTTNTSYTIKSSYTSERVSKMEEVTISSVSLGSTLHQGNNYTTISMTPIWIWKSVAPTTISPIHKDTETPIETYSRVSVLSMATLLSIIGFILLIISSRKWLEKVRDYIKCVK